MTISLITTFYNQKEVLRKQVEEWVGWGEKVYKFFNFCVIDDCSKISAQECIRDIDLKNLNLSIYRIKDDIPWNQPGALNLGAKECRTEWCFLLDMDCFVDRTLAQGVIDLIKEANPKECFTFRRKWRASGKTRKPHPKCCLIRKKDFWEVGGYDEDFCGSYGCDDPAFWSRANGKLRKILAKNLYLIIEKAEHKKHEIGKVFGCSRDASRNKLLLQKKRKNRTWSSSILRFKWSRVK